MQQRQDHHRDLLAYVAPFVLYVVPTLVESSDWWGVKYETICTLKGVAAAAALWWFRGQYPAFTMSGFKTAVFAGVLGVFVWVALERIQASIPLMPQLLALLSMGNRPAFNPYAGAGISLASAAFVVVRLVELVVIVPLIEEIFWRGFLARYLIADDFRQVPQGTFTPLSFAIVTLAFASAHPEFLAAIAWCIMINVLYRQTANLWACVLMHSVTNGLLGIYILATGSWHLW